ncbi:hypothetical protein NS228_18105 [Methylobacterium indicum]|nr:hypothetical protein NS228_18105 [Methylobacterium indicum]
MATSQGRRRATDRMMKIESSASRPASMKAPRIVWLDRVVATGAPVAWGDVSYTDLTLPTKRIVQMSQVAVPLIKNYSPPI